MFGVQFANPKGDAKAAWLGSTARAGSKGELRSIADVPVEACTSHGVRTGLEMESSWTGQRFQTGGSEGLRAEAGFRTGETVVAERTGPAGGMRAEATWGFHTYNAGKFRTESADDFSAEVAGECRTETVGVVHTSKSEKLSPGTVGSVRTGEVDANGASSK